ncbi:membrane transport protein-domain-containing protein [Epithele typhae]|uniref:membrane transport protein-domain-containing protein n=1 Tax=Epithele typhae TaxID=378194 RepID=UPI00200733EB|nr:membrane transport protein-domain-containing protein [Epithele typhae]KAH9916976.1 membrane transport protein-domain-containing protein [Epithele typhae]
MASTGTYVPLLKTVFSSILEVFIVCISGYILARKGILDKATQKKLNRLNVSLFTPSLLFSKVAFFLSPAKLRELWVIPIVFVLTTVVSMAAAYVLGTVMRLKKSQRSFAMAASMFMNSNSLPIALMQSLVVTVPGLKWDKGDNKNSMVGRALTYLVLYSTMGMVLRWSYGVRLLSQADPEGSDDAPSTEQTPESSAPPIVQESIPRIDSIASDGSHTIGHCPSNPGLSVEQLDGNKVFYSFPNTPTRLASPLPPAASASSSTAQGDEDEDDEDGLPPVHRQRTAPTSTRWHSLRRRAFRRAARMWHTFHQFMTVPLWAALASLVVACVQPLQHALDIHLPPVKGAIASLGNCSIPVTLVVLGAYFYSPPDPVAVERRGRRARERSAGLRSASRASVLFDSVRDMFSMKSVHREQGALGAPSASSGAARPGETRTVWVAILSRMIITPLVLLPLMVVCTKFDLQRVFDDPVFVVSNVLLIASPPALTLAQITQAASGDAFERLISRTIFWSYCVVTPPSTIAFVVIGLVLSKL